MRKFKKGQRKTDVYLSGISVSNEDRMFTNSLSAPAVASARNWYLESVFGEDKIAPIGVISTYLLLALAFGWAGYATVVTLGIL